MCKSETENVKGRYDRRKYHVEQGRYSFSKPSVWQTAQERQRGIVTILNRVGLSDYENLKLIEVGCGGGGNLLEFLRMGFRAANISGIELLAERVVEANAVLPAGIVQAGDANSMRIQSNSQDIVYQSVVFSSILDESFQEELASRMWSWVKPGGGVLWYDFVYDNPKNSDVRGITKRRVRDLFPAAVIETRRVTLAPPISRFVTRVHPALYGLFNVVPLLRTHMLCWIAKPS